MSIDRIKLSIVVPIYYNELNIPHTIPRLQDLENIIPDCDFEFVFVDDGSKDRSFSLLMEAKSKIRESKSLS